ncbi:FAD-dependent oxidoreductase [Rhodococcus oxybenzonivorans]|uniref:Pyridine nucleotide-disulfide oxidoreductase domain-containing protein 2 n=1 Tax=Rhodococcus oxybenzonivorans TaxID=1990687 RepID=A0A2S2C1D1_9NOCA|nr:MULTISPECIES: NAD(P)/FAD-dependent oxidoreductase [Rhodococcus]AWK74659.1 FAD-dependent oxidoreductase [Rhodococcus oxybenzonivorans]QTJ67536.1 NAD(P)/FAD-dependent oxidoreductase [Rhodococcus sp. ZPP]
MNNVDAVVIGSGPNGLVAAATLADAGWDVAVVEAQPTAGGAVRSAELVPGYCSDLFSAFYPLSEVSPAIRGLDLEAHGLRWSYAPKALGHARSADDEDAPVIHPDPADTAADLERRQPGDGDAWMQLVEQWHDIKDPLINTLFSPFPPVRGPGRLLRQLGTADTLRLARFLLLPARRMAHELFRSEAARVLLLGNAMHADVPPDSAGSGVMGYILTMLAQDHGYPVPMGGAGELAAAMVRRGERAGAQYHYNDAVTAIDVRAGRAVGVRTASGAHFLARRAVVADVSAPALYGSLLPDAAVSSRLRDDLRHFEWDTPVVKVNYALSHKIPWRSASLAGAGTVHLGAGDDGLVHWMADLTTGTVPETPFLLFGQMTTSDPTRSPEGTESAWAYTHLPRGVSDDASAELLAQRVDDVLEAHAPGFKDIVVGRVVQRPSDLEASNANLVGGAVNGGTAQLHQQLVFRPGPGNARAETPISGLYLGSSSAHPGGGVHGVCGLNAAHAALSADGPRGWLRRRTSTSVIDLLSKGPKGKPFEK